MRYEDTKKLKDKEFRKLTGVKQKTLAEIVEILALAEPAKRKKGGHKSKLSIEDMLLLTLKFHPE